MASQKIIEKTTITGTATRTRDATPIQIEDWREACPALTFMAYVVAAYPIASHDSGRPFGPKRHERFRLAFNFSTLELARECYTMLAAGSCPFWFFRGNADREENIDCIDE